jgi:lipid II:glycine glycyltransferase (peptidoglycan interpeptide bridge formation enzyme)
LSDELGPRVRSFPFSDYCDPLGTPSVVPSLAAPLLNWGAPVTLRVLHDWNSRESGVFRETSRAAWHAVDLSPGPDDLWANLRGSAARNIGRARRMGVHVRVGDSLADVAAFYDLHCSLRKLKYRLLPQPFAFFQHLHSNFGPAGRLRVLLAEWEGRVVAGTLFLAWGDTLYYKFNASIDTSCRPNDLLAWEGIRQAMELGLARLDFGLSDLDQPGLVRFKEKFASDNGFISTLVADPAGGLPPAGALRDVLTQLSELLTHPDVPAEITARGGDLLYRYFA